MPPSKRKSHEISYVEDPGQVKFYLRRPVHLYVPTDLRDDYDPLKVVAPPAQSLELQWVHGYRGKDARNNLFVLASGEAVYFTAGVAVLYSLEDNTQRHYTEHTDDIKSLAVHPDGETVATGQLKGCDDEFDDAHIRVWNSATLETLHVFGAEELHRGVACLAFSKADGGALLAAVDEAQEPMLTVWQWDEKTKIAAAKCASDQVLAVNFSPDGSSRIVTSGKKNVVFWTLDGDALKKRIGVFGSAPKPKYITAVAFTPDGEAITGDSNGNILVWAKDGNEISRPILAAHEGSILHILRLSDGGYLSSGSDRLLKHWDDELIASDASAEVSEDVGGGRAVAEAGELLVVGTVSNCLVKGTMDEDFAAITKGSLNEFWGLDSHPTEGKFLTGAMDGWVTERDIDSHDITWSIKVEGGGVQSVCYSPGGEVAVVGTSSGALAVYDTESLELQQQVEAGDEPLQVVRFSPDGSLLAVGSRDNKVYLYEAGEGFKEYNLRGTCSGHSSFIRSLDFSSDGAILRTNSGDYELLFWHTEDCTQETDSSSVRDTEWATRTCLLCFSNFGVWPEGVDGTDLNAVVGSHTNNLVATADDFGKVKLFGRKTHYAYSGNKSYGGHSSHVTNVAFSQDDSRVLSVGGNDCSVLQWKVTEE